MYGIHAAEMNQGKLVQQAASIAEQKSLQVIVHGTQGQLLSEELLLDVNEDRNLRTLQCF